MSEVTVGLTAEEEPESLSAAYVRAAKERPRYAYCGKCRTTFLDDMPNYGSVGCPNCPEFALQRGINVRKR